jgi:ABC-type lipoprotein release transport system permease subunit
LTRILNDLRFSARTFVRAPGSALALLCTLAMGIGGNVSIDGFVRGFGRSESPLVADDRIVSIFGRQPESLTSADFIRLRGVGYLFEWVAAARVTSGAVMLGGQTAIAPVAAVTPHLGAALGLPLEDGVIISRRLWQNELGSKAEVRGEPIRLAGFESRVAAVAPDWLEGLYRERAVDVWMPIRKEDLEKSGGGPNLWLIGRLRAGVSPAQAQEATRTRVVRYSGMTPEVAAGVERIGALLRLAAAAVLFVAYANVAAFLLGRAAVRSHETSVRVALGAGLRQLARELISDSVVISMVGGAFGALLALWTSRTIPVFLFEEDAQRLVFAPDPAGVAARSAASAGVAILVGLLPLLFTPQSRPATVLRRESGGQSKTVRRLRLCLVAAQMASCCVLVVSAAYLFEGLSAAVRTNAGRRLGYPILATVQASPDVGRAYFRRVEEATRSIPGISGIAWAWRLPGSQPAWQTFRMEPPQLPLRDVAADVAWFTPASLRLFALPPKAGRMFVFGDQSCRTAVVNEEAALKLFGDLTPGRTLYDGARTPVEIVGVVSMRLPGARPTIYYDHTGHSGVPPATFPMARFRTPVDSELARAELDVNVVSGNYFSAMGLPVAAGQVFGDQAAPGACRVGVVNREAAELYFRGNAVGNALIDARGQRTVIIGVVDAAPLGAFQRRAEPAVYLPMWLDDLPHMTMIAGAALNSKATAGELRRKIAAVPGAGPEPPVIQTLETHLTQTALAPLRIAAVMVGAAATLTLVLSGIGLFGALSDAARQRRRELAVRIALGAQRWRVMRLVFGEGGRLACIGIAAGNAGAALLLRWLAGILPGGGAPALAVWLAAPVALFAAVTLASLLPARRASIVNPVSALREEY